MATAVISDVHSNLEALEAVLEDIRRQGIGKVICLGDLVGYGPNPVEVVQCAFSWKASLMGDQEKEIVGECTARNPASKAAYAWIREQLSAAEAKGVGRPEGAMEFLRKLPVSIEEDDVLYVHGSPRDPLNEYLLPAEFRSAGEHLVRTVRELMSKFGRICFVGHTRQPGIITETAEFIETEGCSYRFELEVGKKYILNPGSVGVPRKGDFRAHYAVVSERRVIWRSVPYDFKRTLTKIGRIVPLERAGVAAHFLKRA